jgi:hypothetical protein
MRDKIKLVSSAGTGHFYTTTKNKRTMPENGKNGNQEIRPGCAQACDLQGNKVEVGRTRRQQKKPGLLGPLKKPGGHLI